MKQLGTVHNKHQEPIAEWIAGRPVQSHENCFRGLKERPPLPSALFSNSLHPPLRPKTNSGTVTLLVYPVNWSRLLENVSSYSYREFLLDYCIGDDGRETIKCVFSQPSLLPSAENRFPYYFLYTNEYIYRSCLTKPISIRVVLAGVSTH